ncbi:MAG: pitrilysin family protein [Aestuariivita sp.]|nr:pitrilysin family protein [Aestuariivita sp.]MCY4347513.1 pitrilysin family protein [Aestuariivita sp.]
MRGILAALLIFLCVSPASAAVEIKEIETPSGISAWLVKDHSIPFVALELRFRGGTSMDEAQALGATNLMTALLDEGAGNLDARAYARALEDLAASISYDANDDEITVSAQFLTENRDAAVELLRLAILQPRFDPDALERVRQQILSSLRFDATDPDDIAGKKFSELFFGDHPYGRPGRGTVESVSELTIADIQKAYGAAIARDRVFVSAVGDISEDELSMLLDHLLSGLPSEGGDMPPAAEVLVPGGLTIVPFDSPQSVVLFGHEGIRRDDPDFFTAFVMNHILGGGGFESRLMDEVRRKRGLTYGIYTYLSPKDHGAIYVGSVASSNERVSEAISVIRSEWKRLAEEGVTAAELSAAKTNLTGAYPLRFDGNSRIASIMTGMQMQSLGTDYINKRNDMVNAVTLGDVKRVAARLLRPQDLHFVVVGQPLGLN